MAEKGDIGRLSTLSAPFEYCVVCHGRSKSPLKSLCFHTVCSECYNSIKEAGGGNYKCPLCSFQNGDFPLPKNVFVELALQVFSEGKEIRHLCSTCERKGKNEDALFFCLYCPSERSMFCKKCSWYHSFFGDSHSPMLPIEEYEVGITLAGNCERRKVMCASHPSREVEVVCKWCKAQLCMFCGFSPNTKCPNAKDGQTHHFAVAKEDMHAELKEEIREVSSTCCSNVAALDGLITTAEGAVTEAVEEAGATLWKFEGHKAMVIEETTKTLEEVGSRLTASHRVRVEERRGVVKELRSLRQSNELGYILGERAVSCTPYEDLNDMLTEVKSHQRSLPVTAPPASPGATFNCPDRLEVQKQLNHVVGSILQPTTITPPLNAIHAHVDTPAVINHKVYHQVVVPRECRKLSSLLIGAFNSPCSILCEFDDEKVSRVLASGESCTGVCSVSDERSLFCVYYSSTVSQYQRNSSSTEFNLLKKHHVPGAQILIGMFISSTDRVATTDIENHQVFILNTSGKVLKKLGPSVGGSPTFGSPVYGVWSLDDKYIYVTNLGHYAVPPSVVCVDVEEEVLKWMTKGKDLWTIRLVGGELYVSEQHTSQVSVFDPTDGVLQRTIQCPGKAREMYADGTGKVTIVSFKE